MQKQRKAARITKQDLFRQLPSDIMIDILSRLPFGSIPISKCVCKAWLHLLSTHEFLKSYSSKFGPAIVVLTPLEDSTRCEVLELEEKEGFELYSHYETDSETETETESESETEPKSESEWESEWKWVDEIEPLTRSEFPGLVRIEDSANGLLFLSNRMFSMGSDNIYVCNPITREFCQLQPLPQRTIYGFGASRISGQYKVVAIHPKKPICHVYTLGTRSWRRVKAIPRLDYNNSLNFGAFINGNIYWIAYDLDAEGEKQGMIVSCFDVETECFCTLPIPRFLKRSTSSGADINREFRTLRVFNDGEMIIYYPDKTTNTRVVDHLYGRYFGDSYETSMPLTPSFLSLKTLGMENVISF